MIFSDDIKKMSQLIPWVDKYRPCKIKNIVHQNELMKTLKNIIETGEMPHLLFYGPPGTGKTTTILALANELFGSNKIKERILELNASDDRGIGVVRNKILTFAKTMVSNPDKNYRCPPFKILILDEADAMTPDAQSALRKIMEDTSTITRFCFICNYVDKIIEPIVSRCMQFRFTPISNEFMKERLIYISDKEHLNIDDKLYDVILNIVGGDLRKGIMLLQNIKYIDNKYTLSKKNDKLKDVDIYDLVGYVPINILKDVIEKCRTSSVSEIINFAFEFQKNGYPLSILCSQVCNLIILDGSIDDKKKSQIFIKISKICELLNDGANENIQLLNLLTHINYVLKN